MNQLETLTQAITDLQSQMAFMDDTIETLNDIVSQQALLLDSQQRQLKQIYERLVQLPEIGGLDGLGGISRIEPFDIINDKPPHY